jgi:heat shock protein HtpX
MTMKFLSRSLFILLLLYGLVFAVGDLYLMREGAPLWLAVAFPIVIVGIQYLIGPWLIELFLDIYWDDTFEQLPARNREFIEKLCMERSLKMPRIGIIQSGTPNAFSFGRVRRDARVVVTSGLLEILSPEEANAVLAHEIGHVEHWDFLVMTIAALAPLLLYQFYAFTERINNLRVVAYTAYLCYLLSQFVVLMLNRTREYWADHYAGEVTRAPDQLSSALVKIAYGMVRAEGQYREAMATGDKEEKSHWRRQRRLGGTLALMGISNFRSGAALALGANPAEAAAVMRWDLVNPWARLYELNSTHPLTALRVRQLNEQTVSMHQSLQYPLPPDRRMRWGLFPLEVVLWAAPFLAGVALAAVWWQSSLLASLGITVPDNLRPILLMFIGAAWILRTLYRYRGKFESASVGTLLEDMEVSQMRTRAVRLKGTILGRGLPGAFWSPDLVLRDATGIIFLLYRQSIPFARFLFGLTEAETYIGQEVEVQGWFRRGLTPYVEIAKLTGEGHQVHRTYSRWIQYGLSIGAIVVAWVWLNALAG